MELVQPTVPVVRGGELAIPVKLTRHGGFDEQVKFQADFGPNGVGLPPEELIPSGVSESILMIAADRKAPLGKGPLYVMATTLDDSGVFHGRGRVRVLLVHARRVRREEWNRVTLEKKKANAKGVCQGGWLTPRADQGAGGG